MPMISNRSQPMLQSVFLLLGALVLLFILAPLLGMFLATSPATLFETARETEVRESIWLTLGTSMAATLIFALAAIPLAYLLARKSFPPEKSGHRHHRHTGGCPAFGSRDSHSRFCIPRFFSGTGRQLLRHQLHRASGGIIVAMAFVSIPYLINSARDGFAGVLSGLRRQPSPLAPALPACSSTISLPLAWRNILSGLILMFARGMSEFGAVVVVAYHPMITPVLIYERFGAFGLKYARPVSVLFILITLTASSCCVRWPGKKTTPETMTEAAATLFSCWSISPNGSLHLP
jgi:molybdate/tungstate transport system permease protein